MFFSRRSLLATGAAAVALGGGGARAANLSPEQPSPPTANSDDIQGKANLQNRMTIKTMVNGKGPFAFVVDTGSDCTALSTEIAMALGMLNEPDVIVQGIARSLTARTVALHSLTFGHVTTHNLSVPLLPRAWLGADGYLGLDVIKDKKVTYDFQNQKLTVSVPEIAPEFSLSDDIIIPISGTSGRLKAADCRVENTHALAFIDSGAQASICNTPLFNQLAQNGVTYEEDALVPIIGATGGQVYGRLTSLVDVKLGRLKFTGTRLIVSDLQVFDVWGLASTPALFLGMNFLQQMSAFTIDYSRKELRFKLGQLERIASRLKASA